MHEDRRQAIEIIMDMQGLSFEQASKVLHRQTRIEQIRSEKEQILGHKLPAVFSSKLIERFYEVAPKICLRIHQSWLSQNSTPQDWRFMNDLQAEISENSVLEWFVVYVVPYGDGRPTAAIRVMSSPAQSLAEFSQRLSELPAV